MDNNNLPFVAKPPEESLSKPRKSSLGKIFAVFRLTVFVAAIVGAIASVIPLENLPELNLTSPIFIGVAVITILILGSLFYFIFVPGGPLGTSLLSTSFDLESMVAVVLGVITIIFISIMTIFNTAPSASVIFSLILAGMYTFYIYKVIKETWKIQRENLEIRKKYGELIEIDKEKSDFIMVTSHQLRTPLTEMRWSLDQVLGQSALDEKSLIILKKNQESVNRLAAMVDDMLKTSAFEVKNHILRKTKVDAVWLISDIINSRELFAQQKNVSLNFAEPQEKILLDADKDKIRIVVENVIDNAIRYSPNGKVNISLGTDGKKAKIAVEDTGIGIDINDQNRVFTKFFRAKNAMLVQPNGSGIGLYAAKNIIEQHGGTINFFSELGKGAKFIITLPLAKGDTLGESK